MKDGLVVVDREEFPARIDHSAIEIAQSRVAQEVQAAMAVAKRFPRDENLAYGKIMRSCKRKALAEQSQYAYPRGGSRIEGPSIRLAEVILQNWGNCESGTIELERREGESVVMTYAVDLESNARDVKVFTVPHLRERGESKGGNVMLTDPRDVYELIANMGARRKRACMLAIVPGDIVEAAVEECNRTLKGQNKEPLADRTRQLVAAFLEVGVSGDMLQKRLGHVLDVTSEAELVSLRKIYTSLKDGMGKAADWFDVSSESADIPEGKQSFGFKKQPEEKKAETPESPAATEKSPVEGGGASSPPSAGDVSTGHRGDAAQTAREPGDPSAGGHPVQTDFGEPSPAEKEAIRQREQAEAQPKAGTLDRGKVWNAVLGRAKKDGKSTREVIKGAIGKAVSGMADLTDDEVAELAVTLA